MERNLQQRLLASLVTVPLVIASIALSQSPPFKIFFAIVLSLFAALALKEMIAMVKEKGLRPIGIASILFSIGYIVSILYAKESGFIYPEVILLVYSLTVFLIYFWEGEEPIINLSATFFSFLYVTLPLGYIASIITLNDAASDGRIWLLYLLIVVKATDTAAFFFGKRFGKKPLAPQISPKKTWEGAFFGFAAAIIVSFLFSLLSKAYPEMRFRLSGLESLLLGALLSIAAQLGDLSESLLKRDAGIKDSSTLPGLGGILDIVDSIVFAAPMLYIFLKANMVEP